MESASANPTESNVPSRTGNTTPVQVVEAQTDPKETVTSKKRKEIESRSKVWDHFEKLQDASGVTVKGRCLYCARVFNAHAKRHGTSSLRNHMLNCMKNPYSKNIRKSLLILKPTDMVEASVTETVGHLGT